MRFCSASLAVLLLACWPSVAQADPTLKRFLKNYDASETGGRVVLEALVSTTENSFAWTNSYLKEVRKEKPLYCEPRDRPTTGPEIIEMLRRDAQSKPEMGSYLMGYAILVSLQNHFLCSPPDSNISATSAPNGGKWPGG
jgi:hypothetical protein